MKNVFHATASDFGAVLAAFGIGGIVGATSLLAIEGRQSRRRLCSACALVYGIIVSALALNSWASPFC